MSRRKCYIRIDAKPKDSKKDKEKDKLVHELGLENFKNDLHPEVWKSNEPELIIKSDEEYIEEYFDLEKIIHEEEVAKAGRVHLPRGARRHAYKVHSDHGVIYIPVNRLRQVYQTHLALHRRKIAQNKVSMRMGKPLQPVEIGYNYDVHDGHHRWEASKELGYTHVPCKVVGDDPDKLRDAKEKYRAVWKAETPEQLAETLLQNFVDKITGKKPVSLVLDINKATLNRGKLVKRRVMVKGKDGKVFYRMQWIDPNDEKAEVHQKVPDQENHTTYKHDDKSVKEIERRQHNRFPVVQHEVKDFKNKEHNYSTDKEAYNEAKEKYHRGEKLQPVKVNHKGEILEGHHLVDLARELGLTHAPAIVLGNPKLKKEYEDALKEDVMTEVTDEEGNKKEVSASGKGVSSDGTQRGQHMVVDVPVEYVDDMEHFKRYVNKMYTKSYIMDCAEKAGIKWNDKKADGTLLTDEKILWTRVFNAVSEHIAAGNKFEVPHSDKDSSEKMKQIKKDDDHKFFLMFCNKFDFDREKIKDWCRDHDLLWKENHKDPDIDWKNCAMAIKKELSKGKMLNGVRTRRRHLMEEANTIVTDAVREQVKALGKKYGKKALEDQALKQGIEVDLLDKKGNVVEHPAIRWMRVATAIQKHLAKGNKFKMTNDDFGTEGRIQSEEFDYGDNVTLTPHERVGIDRAKLNSKKFEQRAKKWATKSLALDHGIDPNNTAMVDEVYDAFVEGARNSKLMIHFDPTEMLDSGTSMLEEMMSSGKLKNDFQLDRGYDKEHREVIERDIYGDDFDGAEDHERPVYGVLDIFNQGLSLGQHGGAALVLKEDVKKRSSGTPNDSNSIPYGKEGKLVHSAEDPHHLVIHRWFGRWKEPKNADGKRRRAMNSVIEGSTFNDDKEYFEAQVLGGVDLAKDVDHVLVPEHWQNDPEWQDHHELMKMFAESQGIGLRYE
ncbi:partition protein [Bacillus phage JL]|uniref:Partition protein n=1 Tax=Bacillus phage JL TaxID=1296655 RepID=S5MSH5_9CAUD|nr:ParB-like partition nuclease [Bacillus phage JL]AGR46752.1 partition protein [Bacillus phage JL]